MPTAGPFGSGAFGTSVYGSQPFYNAQTLIDNILYATGHSSPSTEATKRAVILSQINNRYAWVSSKSHWSWLYSTVDFNFEEMYDTGTISMTRGSNTVTGVGTTFSAALLPGWKLLPNGVNHAYNITGITNATTLTIESEFSGSENLSDVTFKIVKPIYELPADVENVQSIVIDGVGEMVPVGTQEMRRIQQNDPQYTDDPRYYTLTARRAADGIRTIEIYPYPEDIAQVHIDYGVNVMSLTDSETSYPLIPDRYRHILYYGGLSEFFLYLGDPNKSALAESYFQRTLSNMENDTQLTDSRLIFQPPNYRNRGTRRRHKVFMNRRQFSVID